MISARLFVFQILENVQDYQLLQHVKQSSDSHATLDIQQNMCCVSQRQQIVFGKGRFDIKECCKSQTSTLNGVCHTDRVGEKNQISCTQSRFYQKKLQHQIWFLLLQKIVISNPALCSPQINCYYLMSFQLKFGSRLATLKRPPSVHLVRSC